MKRREFLTTAGATVMAAAGSQGQVKAVTRTVAAADSNPEKGRPDVLFILLSAHLDVIFSEFPKRVGLMDLAGVAAKGAGMRFGRLFLNDYMARSHGEAMSTLPWDAGVKLLTPRAFDVSRAALDLRRGLLS